MTLSDCFSAAAGLVTGPSTTDRRSSCNATEKNGRLVHGAHLVDARGELLAYETGPAESSAILAAVSGKCIVGGAVLVEIVNLCFEGDPSS